MLGQNVFFLIFSGLSSHSGFRDVISARTGRFGVEERDIELIGAYLAGSDAAFGRLYERYRQPLYGYLRSMLSAADADDVFQQTWIRACAALPGYRCSGKFQAWLFRIARNLALDALRRRIRRREVAEEEVGAEPPDGREPWHEMADEELKRLLEDALRELPSEQRAVFAMRQNAVSFKAIAARQHCPVNTAVVRMKYAMGKIREFLEKRTGGKK